MKRFSIFGIALATSLAHAQIDPQDPLWDSYVVSKIEKIPNANIRDYLIDSRDNNPYGKKIESQLAGLGNFAPAEGNVFWLPHIEVPATEENWRFLSSLQKVSPELRNHAWHEVNGKNQIRIFLHPYSTEHSTFKKLAAKFGGFKFEYQAAATASPRSFVSWKAQTNDATARAPKLSFPTNQDDIFRVKVSIYKLDVDGSRLNPAKKMVRAGTVSHFFDAIPEATKNKIGFAFESENFVAVPDGTDAGFVLRTAPPELKNPAARKRVEPAFSVLRPERLEELAGGERQPLKWITDNLFAPISNVTSYLLMEEGMIGEFHTQNYEFVVDSKGKPTGKLIVHDADSFRSNLSLRALNGKDLSAAVLIDNPFFYLKDSAHRITQSASGDRYTLQTLLSYITDPTDETSFVSAVFDWCHKIARHRSWCTQDKIKDSVLGKLAEDFSKVLGRKVDPSELDVGTLETGKKGLMALMDERVAQLVDAQGISENTDANLQKNMAAEFERLKKQGKAQSYASHSPATSHYSFIQHDDSAIIAAFNERGGKKTLRGIALVDLNADSGASVKFLQTLQAKGLKLGGKNVSCNKLILKLVNNKLPLRPIMRNMGGGNNVN